MKKFGLFISLMILLGLSSTYAMDAETTSMKKTQAKAMHMTAEDKEAMAEMSEEEKMEYKETKREEHKEMIESMSEEEKEAYKAEAKEMREERRQARQEQISAARENLTQRIQAKGVRLSQIPQDKLVQAEEKIEAMIEKYETNEKLSDEVKDAILDQLYALQDMIDAELESEVE